MNDTLWLYHDLDMIQLHIKEPFCFHHFQTFVDKRCRVNRNLLSHRPVRMLQRILHFDMFQIFPLLSTERSAGRCDQQFVDLSLILSVNCLKNRTVLTVHRKDLYTPFSCHRHDQMSRCHQRFFICQCDIFSRLDCRDGRTDSDHSHDRGHQNLAFFHLCQFQQTVHPADDFYFQIADSSRQNLCLFFIPDSCQRRMKFADLFFQQGDIASRTQSRYADVFILSYDFQSLRSNRTG